MINKFFLTIIVSVSLTSCGFSPIYTTSSKQVIISKSEIIGDKDLAFNLEQKLNFKKSSKPTLYPVNTDISLGETR